MQSYKDDIYTTNPNIFYYISITVLMLFAILIATLSHFDTINADKKCKQIYGSSYSLLRVYRSNNMCKDKEGNLKLLNK